MPRRPRLARVLIGDAVIEVYDYATLERVLALVRELQVDSRSNSASQSFKIGGKRNGGQTGAIGGVESNKEHKVGKCRKESKSDISLPSFAINNPWLETLAKGKDVEGRH